MMTIIYETACPSNARALQSPRYGRQRRDRNKTAGRIVGQIALQSGMVHIGDDPLANHFLTVVGIDPADLVVCQVILKQSPMTILAVPSRIWRKPERMARMLRAKRNLADHGRFSVVVPQAAIANNIATLVTALRGAVGSTATACPCGQLHDPVGCAALLLADNHGYETAFQ